VTEYLTLEELEQQLAAERLDLARTGTGIAAAVARLSLAMEKAGLPGDPEPGWLDRRLENVNWRHFELEASYYGRPLTVTPPPHDCVRIVWRDPAEAVRFYLAIRRRYGPARPTRWEARPCDWWVNWLDRTFRLVTWRANETITYIDPTPDRPSHLKRGWVSEVTIPDTAIPRVLARLKEAR
jgi:hypothetical protein